MNTIYISICTYMTDIAVLHRCLMSITQSTIKAKIIIIDNSPSNAIRESIGHYEIVEYIHLPHNPGYGTAHNVAIKKSLQLGIDYHLVLNADVYFENHVIENILDFMNNNLHVAHLMPKVLNSDGTVQRLCKLVPNPIDLIFRRFLPSFFAKNQRRKFELWDSGYNKVMFVPYLSGCFMFLRCSALKEVGIFDERFFMYPEDIDLTRRIASKFDTIFFPEVTVIHEHGAASYKSFRMLLIHILNIIKYFNKWGWIFDNGRRVLNRKTLSSIFNGAK
jgi:GT2 family glycosyltransferase